MSALLLRLLEMLRTSFWFVPSLMGIAAVAAALLLVELDGALDASARDGLWMIYSGGAEGARQVLATIAGSMITVAGVVFSITIVALSVASQQFGPRLLRNFMDDRGNQIVLGTFTALFVYCILVLRTIEGGSSPRDDAVVPHVSITVAVVLAIVALAVLIYFIHHVSLSIQADAIVARVADELNWSIRNAFADEKGTDGGTALAPADDEQAWGEVLAREEGYVQGVAIEALVRETARRGAAVAFRFAPGEFVYPGVVLARVTPERAAARPDWILRAVAIGRIRTPSQDPEFSVGRLTEMALRALSPSLNDPYTAISCIDRLAAGFAFAASRPLATGRFADDAGTTRVTMPLTNLERLAGAAFHEIRQAAKPIPSVSMHLLSKLAQIVRTTGSDEARSILLRHALLVRGGLDAADLDAVDLASIDERFADVLEAARERYAEKNEEGAEAPSSPPAGEAEPGGSGDLTSRRS